MLKIISFVSFAVLLLSIGCTTTIDDNKGVVLARVNDSYLYEADLKNLVPEETSHRDSIFMVRNYVNNWIKSNLMVSKARYNLSDKQLDFDQRLEDYENSLIIYEYESELIKQKLDTTISNEEVSNFYDNHLSDFELKENIVRVFYAVVEKEMDDKKEIERAFSLADSIIIDSLISLSEVYDFNISVDTSKWISFDKLKRKIPIETYNQELFLKHKRFINISDEEFTYMLKFVDFKITDDISPFELVESNIRDIILAKRKIDLINRVRDEIFDQASVNNDFEIYYHE